MADFVRSGLSAHLSPSKRWLMSPHDKNSVHMDGCIPLYVAVDDLAAFGADLERWEAAPIDTDHVGRPGHTQGDQQWPETDGAAR